MYNFITIEGNIGSGKTTLATMLSNQLNADCILESFEENPFLESFYQNPQNFGLHVELFFLMAREKQFTQFFSDFRKKNFDGDKKIFSDFIFDKTKIFAQSHLEKNSLMLFDIIFLLAEKKEFLPDCILYLHRPVSELKKNIARRGRAMEKQIPFEYLLTVENSYKNYFEIEKRFPVLWLNCANIYYEIGDKKFEKILTLLSQKWVTGMHYLEL